MSIFFQVIFQRRCLFKKSIYMRLFKMIWKIPVLCDTFRILVIVPSKGSIPSSTVGSGSRSRNVE